MTLPKMFFKHQQNKPEVEESKKLEEEKEIKQEDKPLKEEKEIKELPSKSKTN